MLAADLTVRRLAPDASITEVHALGRDTFSDGAQCTPGAFWPSLRQLTAIQQSGAIYVAAHVGSDVGFLAVEPGGRVAWLRATADDMGPVCAACTPVAYADFGACWGPVGNPQVRAAAVAEAHGHLVDDGGILRFVP